MQFAQLYQDTVYRLEQAGIESAPFDADLLFEFCFRMSRSQRILSGHREVPENELKEFNVILERRISREPLHYITGVREFWSLDFFVSPSVLIPRPETEFLLECVLDNQRKQGIRPAAVLDMCSGSGVIAIVLAKELTAASITAVDVSVSSLQVALMNRKKHQMMDRVNFICSDLFSGLHSDMKFDLIVANPPYVAVCERDILQPEVRFWEPDTALFAGSEGLDSIVRLADQAFTYMKPGSWLFIEIGADQKEKVKRLFVDHRSGAYEHVKVLSDWSGRPRVLQAKKRERIDE